MPAMKPLYLDNASTTRIDPEVLRAMTESLARHHGNPLAPDRSFTGDGLRRRVGRPDDVAGCGNRAGQVA